MFRLPQVSTTLSSGSIVSTSVVSSPSIAATVTTLNVPALAITGTSSDAEVHDDSRSSSGDDGDDDASNGQSPQIPRRYASALHCIRIISPAPPTIIRDSFMMLIRKWGCFFGG